MLRLVLAFLLLSLLTACNSLSGTSDARLCQALHYRQYQMPSTWNGEGTRSITENSTGVSNREALEFREGGINPILAEAFKRTRTRPDFVLPLLASEDPEAVLTAFWLLKTSGIHGDIAMRNQIADALHAFCMPHKDVRIRWTSLQLLDRLECATPADLDAAIRDRAFAIHELAVHVAPHVERRVSATAQGNADRKLLANTYLYGLASEDWVLRQIASRGLKDWLADSWKEPATPAPKMPNGIILAHADWKTLQDLRNAWATWLENMNVTTASNNPAEH